MVTVISEMSHSTVKFTVKQIPFYYILIIKCIANTVTHSIIYASDNKRACKLHEGILCGKAILQINKGSDDSLIQFKNIWCESGLGSQSQWQNRFSVQRLKMCSST